MGDTDGENGMVKYASDHFVNSVLFYSHLYTLGNVK